MHDVSIYGCIHICIRKITSFCSMDGCYKRVHILNVASQRSMHGFHTYIKCDGEPVYGKSSFLLFKVYQVSLNFL